ncbi:MAG: hypothetical protein KAI16_03460 [Candidatus Pacebacteria bacterium]|nr:hypothetical protein [Candidatus Paceibacterota bacterium]
MKKRMKLLGSALLFSAIVSAPVAFAYQGDPNVQGPNYSPERHTAMTQAFESQDYNAWKNLMEGRGRVIQVVNADNFAKFAEAHKLARSGDVEGAKKIREELGLGMKDGRGRGHGFANKQGQGLRDGSGQKDGQGRGFHRANR